MFWLLGIAYEHDDHSVDELHDLDYAYDTPAVLGQLGGTIAPWLSGSLAGRVDAHSHYGTLASPRASLLAHAGHAFEARVSAGRAGSVRRRSASRRSSCRSGACGRSPTCAPSARATYRWI
jgi:hypothetical protein